VAVGKADQLIKTVFEQETESLTKHGVRFSVPPETKTTELHADGLLSVISADVLSSLPAPWNLIKGNEVLLEFKMQGDKTGTHEIERALLRRQAWQCERSFGASASVPQIPLWVVSSRLPDWLREERLLGCLGDG
jgi:hypothetical protein